jgi:UDP-4-amino-4,6-dideoxy-N-acetyl-beta-L-altrosamine transaminase
MSAKIAANWSRFLLPVRVKQVQAPQFMSYGRQLIEEDDIEAVTQALSGDLLTGGPLVEEFENRLAVLVGAADAVACSSGTAALYIAARALGLSRGKTVIVPAITFAATASAPHLAGADIVFADVDPHTGLMRPSDLEAALARCPNGEASAVFPVHYAGQACDMESIATIARTTGMKIIEDAAHALGTAWAAEGHQLLPVGSNTYSDLSIFSFHPVKTIAMGEGGAVTATDPGLAHELRRFRNHGITREAAAFVRGPDAFDSSGALNPWHYEVGEPSFNFRVSNIQCALGTSQLKKLPRFVETRRSLVACYDEILAPLSPMVQPLGRDDRSLTAWHIYPVRIDFAALKRERGPVMRALAAEGIGTQVHYIPVYRHPYFAARHGTEPLAGAEAYYASTLTLPLHVGLRDADVERVVDVLKGHLGL